MSVYIIPAEDAAALNAHVASEYGQMLFAIEDEHGWTFVDSAFPPGFDFDAVIVACILGPDLAGYLADKPQLASRHCKIYRYLPEGEWDKLAPPMSVNYRTGLDRRLERKTTRLLGDVVSVEYFGSATFNANGSKSFADRVLIEEYEWKRDPPGTLSRDITIRWDLEDGTTHAEAKTMGPKCSIIFLDSSGWLCKSLNCSGVNLGLSSTSSGMVNMPISCMRAHRPKARQCFSS